MRKILLSTLLLALIGCGSVSDPFTFTGGTPAVATQVNARFNTLYNLVNGNIDNDNIKASAGIVFSKLDAATVAGVSATQTLTSKTLTSPDINGGTWNGTIDGAWTAAGQTVADLGTVTTADINGGTIDGVTIGGSSAGAGTFTTLNATSGTFTGALTSPSLPPVGTIVPFYDFNALATFDSDYWVYCDGSVISNASSALDGQTTPDLSNRYLVGFGTEGGGDIDTAAWATAAVGAASHQVTLQHSHTVDGHTHTGPSHTHTGPSHTHSSGTLQFKVLNKVGADRLQGYQTNGNVYDLIINSTTFEAGSNRTGSSVGAGSANTYTTDGTGSTASGGTGATGASGTDATGSTSPGTDNQLSTTQSIQPRSVRVRYLLRVQ